MIFLSVYFVIDGYGVALGQNRMSSTSLSLSFDQPLLLELYLYSKTCTDLFPTIEK